MVAIHKDHLISPTFEKYFVGTSKGVGEWPDAQRHHVGGPMDYINCSEVRQHLNSGMGRRIQAGNKILL